MSTSVSIEDFNKTLDKLKNLYKISIKNRYQIEKIKKENKKNYIENTSFPDQFQVIIDNSIKSSPAYYDRTDYITDYYKDLRSYFNKTQNNNRMNLDFKSLNNPTIPKTLVKLFKKSSKSIPYTNKDFFNRVDTNPPLIGTGEEIVSASAIPTAPFMTMFAMFTGTPEQRAEVIAGFESGANAFGKFTLQTLENPTTIAIIAAIISTFFIRGALFLDRKYRQLNKQEILFFTKYMPNEQFNVFKSSIIEIYHKIFYYNVFKNYTLNVSETPNPRATQLRSTLTEEQRSRERALYNQLNKCKEKPNYLKTEPPSTVSNIPNQNEIKKLKNKYYNSIINQLENDNFEENFLLQVFSLIKYTFNYKKVLLRQYNDYSKNINNTLKSRGLSAEQQTIINDDTEYTILSNLSDIVEESSLVSVINYLNEYIQSIKLIIRGEEIKKNLINQLSSPSPNNIYLDSIISILGIDDKFNPNTINKVNAIDSSYFYKLINILRNIISNIISGTTQSGGKNLLKKYKEKEINQSYTQYSAINSNYNVLKTNFRFNYVSRLDDLHIISGNFNYDKIEKNLLYNTLNVRSTSISPGKLLRKSMPFFWNKTLEIELRNIKNKINKFSDNYDLAILYSRFLYVEFFNNYIISFISIYLLSRDALSHCIDEHLTKEYSLVPYPILKHLITKLPLEKLFKASEKQKSLALLGNYARTFGSVVKKTILSPTALINVPQSLVTGKRVFNLRPKMPNEFTNSPSLLNSARSVASRMIHGIPDSWRRLHGRKNNKAKSATQIRNGPSISNNYRALINRYTTKTNQTSEAVHRNRIQTEEINEEEVSKRIIYHSLLMKYCYLAIDHLLKKFKITIIKFNEDLFCKNKLIEKKIDKQYQEYTKKSWKGLGLGKNTIPKYTIGQKVEYFDKNSIKRNGTIKNVTTSGNYDITTTATRKNSNGNPLPRPIINKVNKRNIIKSLP